MKDAKLLAVAAILFVIVIVLAASNYGLVEIGWAPSQSNTTKFDGIVLPGKPTLSGAIVSNPDFVFNDYGWLSISNGSVDPRNLVIDSRMLGLQTKWHGDGVADNNTYFGRSTVVIIHPFSASESRYVEQTVVLPYGKTYYLVFGLANLAKYLGPTGCDDNVFRVSITDKSAGVPDVIFDGALNTKDGWKDYMVGISKYAGKEVTIRVDGIAGGPCGNWLGEWGAVDYVDVISSALK